MSRRDQGCGAPPGTTTLTRLLFIPSESSQDAPGENSKKRKVSTQDSGQDGTGRKELAFPTRGQQEQAGAGRVAQGPVGEGCVVGKADCATLCCVSAGSCVEDLSQTLPEKRQRAHAAKVSSQIQKAPAAPPRASRSTVPGRKKRHVSRMSRAPAHQEPALRKSLVLSLRSLSQAIYQDVVQLYAQQGPWALTQDQLYTLPQLRESLRAAAQTCYALSQNAAWAFPAQGWLLPSPPLEPDFQSRTPDQSFSAHANVQTSPKLAQQHTDHTAR